MAMRRKKRHQRKSLLEGRQRQQGAAKFAASLPADVFYAIEQRCIKEGITRSAALNQAVQMWLKRKMENEMEAKYRQGYARKPEKQADIDPFFIAGLSSFSEDEW